jgi:hypothetical protein
LIAQACTGWALSRRPCGALSRSNQHENGTQACHRIDQRISCPPEFGKPIAMSGLQGQSSGRFLLLDSASIDLLKQSSESLAGRIFRHRGSDGRQG